MKLQLQTLHKESLFVRDYFDKLKGLTDKLGAINDKDLIVTICSGLMPCFSP